MTLREIADALCGKINRRRVIASWPHGDGFRQLVVWLSWQAPHGIVVLPREARPYVLGRLKRLL